MSAAAQMSATVTLSKPRSAKSARATSTVWARLSARLRSRSPSTSTSFLAESTHQCGIVCLLAFCATSLEASGVLMSHAPTATAVLDPAAEPDDGWHPQQIAALAVVAVCGVLVALTQSILIPVLGALQQDLGSSTTGTEWLLTSTLLVAAVAVPVFGRLGDLYGKRRMLLVATSALVVGSVVCALADSIGGMIVGRAITGASAAAIPLGISLIGSVLPAKRAGSGIALVSATLGIGGALGLPLAALVAEHTDYHVLFWICVVGGIATFLGIWFALNEVPPVGHGRMDFPGAVLLAAALVCLLLPLAEATKWGWSDPKTIGLLGAAAVLLVVFVLVERRVASPLVDMVVNARPSLLLTNIASLCV